VSSGDTLVMTQCPRWLCTLFQVIGTLWILLGDSLRCLRLCLRCPTALAAENRFLRKQLALYQEHHVPPQRATAGTRLVLTWLSGWFNWRQALVIVQPATLLRWHREGLRLCWWWKSRRGRPPIPEDLQALIRHMAREHPTWGQERIANELRLKLGLRVSPRTVRKYMPKRQPPGPGKRVSSQRWATFVRDRAGSWPMLVIQLG
jgi:putative transposase